MDSFLRYAFRAFAIASLATLPATATAQSVDRVTGWRSDISFWLDQVRNQHYVYKSKPLPPALIKAANMRSLYGDHLVQR